MSILQLPEETFCKIVSLTIGDEYHSPCPQDLISLTRLSLYNISYVCRGWRKITLGNPSLWSSIYMKPFLFGCSGDILEYSTIHLNRCLERSKNVKLTCSIDFDSTIYGEKSPGSLLHDFFRSLSEHQSRWKAIKITFPMDYMVQQNGLVDLIFQSDKLQKLESLDLMTTSTFKFRISGSDPLKSLTSLKLNFRSSSSIANDWLIRTPNLEELVISTMNSEADLSTIPSQPITLEHLRTLAFDMPLSGLHLLHCPALENLNAGLMITMIPNHNRSVHDFLLRSPPSRALYGKQIVSHPDRDTMLQGYLDQLPKLEILSLSFIPNRSVQRDRREPCPLFTMLSDRTPEIQHLEVFDVVSTLESALDFVIARWTQTDRKLKSVKLKNCLDTKLRRSFANIVADPGALPITWEQVKTFIEEGLVLEIS